MSSSNENRDFWREVLSTWRFFVCVLAINSVLAYLYLKNTIPIYVSEIRVAPVTSDSSGFGGLSNKIGGFAAGLVGIDLGSGGVESDVVTIETLRSSQFIMEFLESNNAVPIVMAVNLYDKREDVFLFDESLYDSQTKTWISGKQPSTWKVLKRFNRDFLYIEKEGKTGVITIQIRSPSPLLSKQWVAKIVDDLNAHMKAKALRGAQLSLDYLNEQVTKTELNEMRSVFYSLIEEQHKSMMFATAKEEYALRVLNEPVLVDSPVSPNVPFVLIAVFFSTVSLSVIVVLLRRIRFYQSQL